MSAVLPITEDPRFRISTATEGQTEFTVPFPFQANGDVKVILVDVDDSEVPLAEADDYTLTGAGSPTGGTLTLVEPCLAGQKVVRYGDVALTRTQSITRAGKYDSKATDDDLDRIILALQEVQRDLGRALKAKLGDTGGDVVAGAAGLLVQWGPDGSLVEGPDPNSLGGGGGGSDSAAQILVKLLTVDGAGSGLDADLLDGLSSAAFAAAVHTHTWAQITSTPTTFSGYGITDVQPLDATLTSIAALGTGAGKMAYTTGVDTWAETSITAAGRALIDDADAAAQRATLGLLSMATQAASAVAITGGTIAGITDLAIADGGTGASSAGAARTNLGLVIGTDVQAYDADLAAIAGVTFAADKGVYFTGSGAAAAYDLTSFARTLLDDANAGAARTTLGLVIGTDVQAYHARLGDIAGIAFARGDIVYYNGTNLVKLGPGTSGWFLKSNGAGADPSYAAIAGGGDLLSSNNLSDVASAATARTNLGLTIDTNVPSQSAFDLLRRNTLLNFANMAKALAGLVRFLDTVALGFKASGDADATSTGGTVDTSAGAWKPSSAYSVGTFLTHLDGSNGATTFAADLIGGKAITGNGSIAISTTQSEFGGAAIQAGSGKYLSVSNHADFQPGTGDFCWDAWVYFSAQNANGHTLWTIGYIGSGDLLIQTDGGASPKVLAWCSGVTIATESSGVATGGWHHYEVSRTSGTLRIFRDGVQTASAANSTNLNSTGNVHFAGTSNGGGSAFLNGYMDEVRWTKGAGAGHTSTFTPPASAYAPSTTNAVLITPYQTADAARTKVRGICEIDPVDTITLGSDWTIEYTCDGGAHWAPASTYTNCGKGQSGRTVVETDEVTCTSGTSFAARVKNLNTKMVHVYKTTLKAAA